MPSSNDPHLISKTDISFALSCPAFQFYPKRALLPLFYATPKR